MADDYLSQGIAAVKAGDTKKARQFLDAAIKGSPNDERGWGWFYNVCENDEERLRCVREILRINPNNEKAKQKYDELIGLDYQTSAASPKAAMIAEVNNAKSSQSVDNKGSISTIEWIIIGILGGGAILAIIILGILFLFQNVRLPSKQIPTPQILSSNQLERPPVYPAVQMPSLPTLVIPTLLPFPTFPPTDTPPPTVTAALPFIPQTQQLGPIHDTERGTYFSLEVTATDVKWLTSDTYQTPKTGDIYLIVYFKAKNLGPDSVQSIGSSDFQILDSNGLVHDYTYIPSADTCQQDSVDMLPNGEYVSCDGFEVPRIGKLEFIYAPYKNEPLNPGRYLSITIRP